MPCSAALKALGLMVTLRFIATAMLLLSWGSSSESDSESEKACGILPGARDLDATFLLQLAFLAIPANFGFWLPLMCCSLFFF